MIFTADTIFDVQFQQLIRLINAQSDFISLDESDFKRKNRSFWKPAKKYFQVEYQIKFFIGSVNIRFEIC